MADQIIHIRPEAPPKPSLGAPCNGCGVCCLAEPCPLGQVVSRKRSGACDALRWDGVHRGLSVRDVQRHRGCAGPALALDGTAAAPPGGALDRR